MGPGVSAAKFHENTSEFGVVYGLALQGVGLARIESNLLPSSIARSQAWAIKFRIFVAAAALLLMVSLLALGRSVMDTMAYNGKSNVRQTNNSLINRAQEAIDLLDNETGKTEEVEVRISTAFDRFRYRHLIPQIHELIFSLLPNAQNNPQQSRLYEAFEQGDVEAIKAVPRRERKQLFVTAMKVQYVDDVNTARFGQMTSMMGMGGEEEEMYDDYMDDYMMEEYYGEGYGMDMGAEEVAADVGFLVTLEGYSPYGKISDLLDPPGVADQRNRWGVVTRLLHLDDLADVNSPFELYGKGDTYHFELETAPVDVGTPMPMGVGVFEKPTLIGGSADERPLLDPFTR
ncbi:MAG: hypothetical protein MI922_04585, partial [Bacteroidales bacterium]|nr:hypothetical protein [Bacteroidales bacterium]